MTWWKNSSSRCRKRNSVGPEGACRIRREPSWELRPITISPRTLVVDPSAPAAGCQTQFPGILLILWSVAVVGAVPTSAAADPFVVGMRRASEFWGSRARGCPGPAMHRKRCARTSPSPLIDRRPNAARRGLPSTEPGVNYFDLHVPTWCSGHARPPFVPLTPVGNSSASPPEECPPSDVTCGALRRPSALLA